MYDGNKIKNPDLLFPELSYQIKGAILKVWKEFGPAFKEVVYQRALEKEFKNSDIKFESQKQIPIYYDGEKVGVYVPDFIVEDKIILEIKQLSFLGFKENQQAWYYLKGSHYKLLLLINFGGEKLQIKRIVYDKSRK
jgi:GxxExxY protein